MYTKAFLLAALPYVMAIEAGSRPVPDSVQPTPAGDRIPTYIRPEEGIIRRDTDSDLFPLQILGDEAANPKDVGTKVGGKREAKAPSAGQIADGVQALPGVLSAGQAIYTDIENAVKRAEPTAYVRLDARGKVSGSQILGVGEAIPGIIEGAESIYSSDIKRSEPTAVAQLDARKVSVSPGQVLQALPDLIDDGKSIYSDIKRAEPTPVVEARKISPSQVLGPLQALPGIIDEGKSIYSSDIKRSEPTAVLEARKISPSQVLGPLQALPGIIDEGKSIYSSDIKRSEPTPAAGASNRLAPFPTTFGTEFRPLPTHFGVPMEEINQA